MNTVVNWHVRAARLATRLFLLHLLWLLWTLRGAVVLGVFPATAAMIAAIRHDVMAEHHGEGDDYSIRLSWSFFAATWRREFGAANRLGWLLAAGWAVLLLDRHLVATVNLGPVSPVLAGLLSVLTGLGLVVTAMAWCLAAHFAEPARGTILRSVKFTLSRPVHAVTASGATAVICAVYYVVPGLAPVLGLAAPAFVCFRWLWHTGVLPVPPPRRHAEGAPIDTPTEVLA